ncbi:MAG: di-heme oxidoredictase family protein [Bryobacteraceae bacterium]
MRITNLLATRHAWASLAAVLLAAVCGFGQTDPGPRGGPAGAGGTFPVLDNTNPTLNAADKAFFAEAFLRFQEVDSVSGTIESGSGLGPTFNGNACAMCHLQPAIGGSSAGLTSKQNPIPNPQVALATLHGANNTPPSFITASGPVREARFISTDPSQPGAPLDGGVHDLYTIAGRSDAPGCTLAQTDFTSQLAAHNVIFRIPTPLFGLGLVENTSDEALQLNLSATASQRAALGIGGTFNTSGNDGTITRFGWKAQNKTLLIFAGEAYNVEQGVSNDNFANERFPAGTPPGVIASCTFNATPEDTINIINPNIAGSTTGNASAMSSDIVNFAATASLLAPAVPTTASSSELNGQRLFSQIGCNLCHSTSLTTGLSNFPALSHYQFHPYSDFALHHMGPNLADGIVQGAAGPDQFRSAPLWGIGQRLFFLHDGRTADLLAAILAHFSPGPVCNGSATAVPSTASSPNQGSCGSEANQVIQAFNALSNSQQQDLLNFLRSL